MDEKLILHIHFTKTGLPADNEEAGLLSGTHELTLNQLKQRIIDSGIIESIPKDTVCT
jgi:hypothetical protein